MRCVPENAGRRPLAVGTGQRPAVLSVPGVRIQEPAGAVRVQEPVQVLRRVRDADDCQGAAEPVRG